MASVVITLNSTNLALEDIRASAVATGLQTLTISQNKLDVFSENTDAVKNWQNQFASNPDVSTEFSLLQLKPYTKCTLRPHTDLRPSAVGRSWFTAKELGSIYNFPAPNTSTKVVVGVVSFGGGVYGSIDANGVLTNSDMQAYWTAIGIPPANHPKVVVVLVNGAVNNPSDDATVENILDIQALGGVCPSPNLTIILYISPSRTLSSFYTLLSYIYNTSIAVNGLAVKPTIISCSWGASEIYFSNTDINNTNGILATMNSAGMNFFTATGDFGSNNNVGGTGAYVDFPSSSPYVTAVGGTTLFSPNNIYDGNTTETAWSSGGGGISVKFAKPAYQSSLNASGRCLPDIAAVADPNTGMLILLNNQYQVIGGTSLAAPIVAGFLACFNGIGFINPKLYTANANCFHDITSGSNGDYSASVAHDNCTGMGSISGANLKDYLTNIPVTGISVLPTTLALIPTQTGQLTVTITPPTASNKSVTWSSSNTAIATVNSSGLVTGVATGQANIVVTTVDGTNLSATTVVTVSNSNPVAVASISLNVSSASVNPTSTYQLVATIVPSTATNKNVTWSSGNTAIATVNSSGLVTGVALGTTTVTVTSVSNPSVSQIATITVTQPVTSISLSNTTLNVNVGQNKTLTATVLPANAANKAVTWSTSNSSIATVNSSGAVRGVAPGNATITATTVDRGFTASCVVTVVIPITSITMNFRGQNMIAGRTFQAVATVSPSTATNKTLTWASNNSAIATVNSSGLITAVGNGTALITASATDGSNKGANISITVTTKVTGITLQSTLSLNNASTFTLVPTISPANASNKGLNWTSSNTTIAAVNAKGQVRGIKAGVTTITVRTTDGNFTANCVVTVL